MRRYKFQVTLSLYEKKKSKFYKKKKLTNLIKYTFYNLRKCLYFTPC